MKPGLCLLFVGFIVMAAVVCVHAGCRLCANCRSPSPRNCNANCSTPTFSGCNECNRHYTKCCSGSRCRCIQESANC